MSKYMTVKEAAEYLGVSTRTIYRWANGSNLRIKRKVPPYADILMYRFVKERRDL